MTEAEKAAEIALWQTRASACELLALSLRYPDEGLQEIVASGEWADAAREIWDALGVGLPEDWAAGVEATDFHDLRADATRLFVGTPKAACCPYESWWRAVDEGVQPLMFINSHAMDVEHFCKSCGLVQSKDTPANEPLDHIATEFELLEFLASVEAGIGKPVEGGPAPEDFPGGSAKGAYEAFVADHLDTYAARFADALEREARTDYYRAVARLVRGYVA